MFSHAPPSRPPPLRRPASHLPRDQKRSAPVENAKRDHGDVVSNRGRLLGRKPDYLGDRFCNSGAHGPRHNAVLRDVRDVIAAVATNSVLLGDKEQRDHY